jgi:hypothetical protein
MPIKYTPFRVRKLLYLGAFDHHHLGLALLTHRSKVMLVVGSRLFIILMGVAIDPAKYQSLC